MFSWLQSTCTSSMVLTAVQKMWKKLLKTASMPLCWRPDLRPNGCRWSAPLMLRSVKLGGPTSELSSYSNIAKAKNTSNNSAQITPGFILKFETKSGCSEDRDGWLRPGDVAHAFLQVLRSHQIVRFVIIASRQCTIKMVILIAGMLIIIPVYILVISNTYQTYCEYFFSCTVEVSVVQKYQVVFGSL